MPLIATTPPPLRPPERLREDGDSADRVPRPDGLRESGVTASEPGRTGSIVRGVRRIDDEVPDRLALRPDRPLSERGLTDGALRTWLDDEEPRSILRAPEVDEETPPRLPCDEGLFLTLRVVEGRGVVRVAERFVDRDA